MPRILLAEDDPVSRAFLVESLQGCRIEVIAVGAGDDALAAARRERFDLLILDHRLPGWDGDRVLTMLRADASAASQSVAAIATTADPDPDVHARLRDACFAYVLVKPMDAASLRETLCGLGVIVASLPLDNDAGLAASGSAEALRALRGLFAAELSTLDIELETLRRDPVALSQRLHRLRAACGFCGAKALDDAAAALTGTLRSGDQTRIVEATIAFRSSLTVTRTALCKQGAGRLAACASALRRE